MDVATLATVEFLAGCLPDAGAVLEVGCGNGLVALELMERGYDVLAIDADEEAIEQARDNGVAAVHADWADFECLPVDAVAFTRSLHHVDSLPDAVRKAADLLVPGGLLLVEDFAVEAVDERTLRWFLGVLHLPQARELLKPRSDELLSDLMSGKDPVEAWNRNHDHELHSFAEMEEEVAQHFPNLDAWPVPYFYRYLIDALPETAQAALFVKAIAVEEAARAAGQEITMLGRRIVARL